MLLALSFFGMALPATKRRAPPDWRLTLGRTGTGTLLCGLAPSMDGLIAARALAGMGGGG